MIDEESEDKRMEVSLLGRKLGTASGWDGDLGECMWFYDFEPAESVILPKGELQVDFIRGLLGIQDGESGEIIEPKDIVEFLHGVKL